MRKILICLTFLMSTSSFATISQNEATTIFESAENISAPTAIDLAKYENLFSDATSYKNKTLIDNFNLLEKNGYESRRFRQPKEGSFDNLKSAVEKARLDGSCKIESVDKYLDEVCSARTGKCGVGKMISVIIRCPNPKL